MRAVIGAAMVLLAIPAATRAGDAACLWNHFPADKSAAVLTHDIATLSATMAATFTTDEFVASFAACGVTANTEPAANAALHAYALELKSEKLLLAAGDLTPDRLDAAWVTLDAPAKSALAKHALDNTAETEASTAAINLFADRVGLKGQVPDTVGSPLATYLLVRAAVGAYEQQF